MSSRSPYLSERERSRGGESRDEGGGSFFSRFVSRDGQGVNRKLSSVQISRDLMGWRWPLDDVTITSGFGERDRGAHEGVDLRARSGTPVRASAAGSVVYAGRGITGYGRLVVLRHPGGLFSLYAHNSRLLVRDGARVKRGQRIALSGRTGRASGPHVHFEVRHGERPLDPELWLPKPSRWARN